MIRYNDTTVDIEVRGVPTTHTHATINFSGRINSMLSGEPEIYLVTISFDYYTTTTSYDKFLVARFIWIAIRQNHPEREAIFNRFHSPVNGILLNNEEGNPEIIKVIVADSFTQADTEPMYRRSDLEKTWNVRLQNVNLSRQERELNVPLDVSIRKVNQIAIGTGEDDVIPRPEGD